MRRESGLRPRAISPGRVVAPCSAAPRPGGAPRRGPDPRPRTESRAARAIGACSARWKRGQAASASALLGNEPLLPRDRVRIFRLGALLQPGKQIALLIAVFLAPGLSVVGLFSLGRAGAAFLVSGRTFPLTRIRLGASLGSGSAARRGRRKPVRDFACFATLGRSLAIVRHAALVYPFVDLGERRRGQGQENQKVW